MVGLKHARELATISYRSGPEWEERFGRRLAPKPPGMRKVTLHPDFLIETYLDHQGNQWCTGPRMQYDPNSLLYISKAMDMFDISNKDPSITPSHIGRIQVPTLVSLSHTRIKRHAAMPRCRLCVSVFRDIGMDQTSLRKCYFLPQLSGTHRRGHPVGDWGSVRHLIPNRAAARGR